MRRELRHHHRQQRAGKQFELFASTEGNKAEQAPGWDVLPEQTRAVLTALMARLILDHAQAKEMRHDV
jgi:hypothetical protein